ncbi:Response regulator protein VraR [Nocardioides aquaticus]|jgi:NarL family two-component system response regulator LiaR|uniref:Response regulator protein VraR n=1 Tax=Nocardioides aquaticus TaxID=160826 RepID=A0ABX8EJJ6_9ACTN|nr:response regulator transcription factor [Nocardioides aquaticus]QVT80694.1 Response regulator protein VraR [Nocardioides aquaticus]
MSASPVRIAVVNDYAIVVAGTARVLEPFSDRVEVVELDSRKPVVSDVDVVLYDTFGKPQGASCDPARLVGAGARFLVFSWNTDPDQVRASLERGAHGYVSKACSAEELVEAVERVHRGERVTPGDDDAPERGELFGRWPGDEHGLSARESEVLALICQGLSNVEISQRAYIGINTVKTYIRSAYRKIGATTRPQAVIWGLSHGFEPDRVRRVLEDRTPPSASSAG